MSIGFYTYYQNRYPQLTYQQHYNTKSNTEVKVDNPAKHFRSVEGNYLANNYSNSYEVGPSSSVPQPRPSPVPVGCLPYFKELHVMPIPEHGEECTEIHELCHFCFNLLNTSYGVRVLIIQDVYCRLQSASHCYEPRRSPGEQDVPVRQPLPLASPLRSQGQ